MLLKAGVLAEPVLVGRERELEQLKRSLDSAINGNGNTVFVSGEAGSGKTRLTREFLDSAREEHVAILSGWCLSDAATPYFPFVEAFNSYFSRFEDEEPMDLQKPGDPLGFTGTAHLTRVDRGITAWLSGPKMPERPSRPEAVSPQVWKDQVFAGVAKTLHKISSQEPVILLLEDIHWADSASLALLHYLARVTKNTEKILVLATLRSEELTTDAEGRPHPLAEILRMMDREDLYKEIKLQSLNHTEVSRVAESMMGGRLQRDFAQKLEAESRGNPLFVVESLRMLSEQGNLRLEQEGWRLSVDALGIPGKLKNIILRRLSVLKFNQRRILDAASVIGEKFDPELLTTVLGEDTLGVLEALNTIAQSTSLVKVEGCFFRFDHAKSREAVYEEIPLPLKRGYHARVAERLEGAGKGDRLPFGEMAFHYAAAGNEAKAVKFAFDAGQDALARWSNSEAVKHFAYVLEKAADTPENAETRRLALEGLGDAYFTSGLFSKALDVFEQLGDSVTGSVKLRAYRKAADAIFFGTKEWSRF
jgi:predicted ATPase